MTDISTLRANYYKAEYLRTLPRPAPVFSSEVFTLPYLLDAAKLMSGALPSWWSGITFRITNAVVTNTPRLGSELLTDPGLEANYTAGLCDSLTDPVGGFSHIQSSDVHGGNKAQLFIASAFNNRLNWATVPGTIGAWYSISEWGKRAAGVGTTTFCGPSQTGALPSASTYTRIVSAGWVQKKASFISTTVNNIYPYAVIEQGGAPFPTVIVDDGSMSIIDPSTLFAVLGSVDRDASVKVQPSPCADQTISAVILWASGTTPNNYVFATWRWRAQEDFITIGLYKCVGGVYSALIAEQAQTIQTNAWIELRVVDDTTLALYYYNTQIGANVTVADVTGDRPGLIVTGDNTVKKFYCGYPEPISLIFAGSSFSTYAVTSYNGNIQSWINTTLPGYDATFTTIAIGGQKSWGNLVNLSRYLSGNITTILLDTANDITRGVLKDQCSLEGFIRQVWNYNPDIRIIGISSPSWNGQDISNDANTPTPTNLLDINQAYVIFKHYRIPYAHYHRAIIDLVAAGHHLNEYVSGDTVHPSTTGYALMASLVEPHLPDYGAYDPFVMPSRIYPDTVDYEHAGLIKAGTAYDSRTGVWSDVGTKTSSANPGATITFSGMLRSFGWCNAVQTYANVSVSIDGGAAINPFTTGWGGYDIGVRANHTIVFTVLTNMQIDEFWAI
jgi:hypothetical protein